MNSSISNSKLKAVKAIIYRSDFKILLQKRDQSKGITYKLKWNFFGGEVEKNENVIDALKRELFEELEYIPLEIGQELLNSKLGPIDIHYFPIKVDDHNIKFNLNEGLAYEWFSLTEIIEIDLVPVVYESLSKIADFFQKHDQNYLNVLIESYEAKLIKHLCLKKKNDRVFFSNKKNINLCRQDIFLFLFLNTIKNIPVSRICLHQNENNLIHEMYMFHSEKTSVGPLKQNTFESIAYHILEGTLEIELIEGETSKKTILQSNNEQGTGNLSYRLNPSDYRIVRSISDFCIFLEINNGPFKESDTIWK